ncbi:nitroreductase family deazaflavin-dependent oxidoreductase [Pseudonocardia acidicola]|uniref:Nitroreductase family deazaflavin-dependent oxidoreductase n=1 Tax=Pseudonocardia acidicola TaxID=2724939 RepID=A0ABX1SH57_9PSEU|nr:nitroreductase family deazaflavin-dependent oxidoreductase [Pseudonocardia acidicola]NMH99721.1 nitroreductase family deazaflavin-dependent oxidoreductase [Pseudonocardia acidicola]
MSPLPRAVARFNRKVLNHVTTPIASWLPGFGVVVHRGRRSGRTYRTPVNVFPTSHGYVVALTYGPGADWVRNVAAAGGCVLHTGRRHLHLTEPRVFHDESRRDTPLVVRRILGLTGVADFLELRLAPGTGADDR